MAGVESVQPLGQGLAVQGKADAPLDLRELVVGKQRPQAFVQPDNPFLGLFILGGTGNHAADVGVTSLLEDHRVRHKSLDAGLKRCPVLAAIGLSHHPQQRVSRCPVFAAELLVLGEMQHAFPNVQIALVEAFTFVPDGNAVYCGEFFAVDVTSSSFSDCAEESGSQEAIGDGSDGIRPCRELDSGEWNEVCT